MTPISSILKCAHSTASSKQTQDVCFGFVSVCPVEIQKLSMRRKIIGLSWGDARTFTNVFVECIWSVSSYFFFRAEQCRVCSSLTLSWWCWGRGRSGKTLDHIKHAKHVCNACTIFTQNNEIKTMKLSAEKRKEGKTVSSRWAELHWCDV